MSKRIVIIDNCDKCPHFDNQYYSYEEVCTKLKRKIERKDSPSFFRNFPIPEDCPLEKTND